MRHLESIANLSKPLNNTWSADSACQQILASIEQGKQIATQIKIKPRLVIFSYPEDNLATQLYELASKLGIIVGVELITRNLAPPLLSDRLHLLEKSRGIHGISFPLDLTYTHQNQIRAHQGLKRLSIDAKDNRPSPLVASVMHLASVYGWQPKNKRAAILASSSHKEIASKTAKDLESLGIPTELILDLEKASAALSQSELILFCSGSPVNIAKAHLSPLAIVIDCSSLLGSKPVLSYRQELVLSHRQRGYCSARTRLNELINLLRIQRLYIQALDPQK